MKASKWILLLLLVILSFIVLILYFGMLGFLIGLPWSILWTVLTNLDRVADVIASSYKLGRKVSFWFEKNAVEKRLEVTIGSASKKVNEESGEDLLPHSVDIKWVEPQARDAFLKKGEIVVCLESSYNEEKNLARATMLYVEEDLIRESQRFVNTTIMKSLIFAISRKMLMLDRKLSALKCPNKEFIEPEIEKRPQIKGYVLGMDNMDKQGYLTRVLLREFSQLGAKLSPAATDTQAKKETKAFTKLFKRFVEKREEEEVELNFNGSIFRIQLMPIAKLRGFDISNFVKAASYTHTQNIDIIYVLARGLNVEVAKLVIAEIEKTNLYLKKKDWEYKIVGTREGQPRSYRNYLAELSKV